MKNNPAQMAIDDLTEIALYREDHSCSNMHLIDDELYNLVQEFSTDYFNIDGDSYMQAYMDINIRRMFYLFMAEMLKSNGGVPENKPEPPFDGVSWLFENHWITYDDVLRGRAGWGRVQR